MSRHQRGPCVDIFGMQPGKKTEPSSENFDSKKQILKARKAASGFLKNYKNFLWRSLYAILLLAVLVLLPELYAGISGAKERALSQVKEKFQELELTVTYEGADFSAWSGLSLYHFKIARGEDFNQGRELLHAPRARFIPGVWGLFSDTPQVGRVVLEKATWVFPVGKKKLQKKVQKIGALLLERPDDIKIELIDNTLQVIFEKSNYYKETWNIAEINGSFKKKGEAAHLLLKYHDYPWGEGSFEYESRPCAGCALSGRYRISIDELPIHRLSWFFEEYELKNGFASLELDLQEPQDSKELLINGELRLHDLQVQEQEKIFYQLENSNLFFEINAKSLEGPFSGSMRGVWDGYPLEMSFQEARPESFPEHLKIQIDGPTGNDSGWAFPGVGVLSGVRHVALEFVRESKGYNISSGELHVARGAFDFFADRAFQVELGVVDLKVQDNAYELFLSLQKGASDFKLTSQGELLPRFRQVLLNLYDAREIKSRRRYLEMLVLKGTHQGKIELQKFDLRDLRPYVDALTQEYTKRRRQGLAEGWKESLFQERAWFQRYLAFLQLDYDLVLNEWGDGVVQKRDWTGKLSLNRSELLLSLQGEADKEKKEQGSLSWKIKNNFPTLSGEFELYFSEPGYLSSFFISKELLKDFREAHLNYSFSSGGERAADLFSSHRGNGFFEASELVFHPEIAKDIPVTWEELSCFYRRNGGRIWFSSVQATRQGYDLNASAMWNFEGESSTWKLNPYLRHHR